MKIAIVGDVHGKIGQMYRSILDIEESNRTEIDLILQLGDFQATRDERDLRYLSGPHKYRKLGDFPEFHEKGKVPKKTFFIGGNHENNYWHKQHPGGNQLVENLFYLGRSGIKAIGDLKMAWISGNYSPKDYSADNPKKYHHFTEKDVQKVLKQQEGVDVLLLHDWPSIRELAKDVDPDTVSNHETLSQAMNRDLGSTELYELVRRLRPKYVFAGHVHMPLDLEAKIEETDIRFIALNKLEFQDSSIYLLDTDNLEITNVSRKKQNLFDILKEEERRRIQPGFGFLEEDSLTEAIGVFERILSNSPSEAARSFANYGVGVVYSKKVANEGFQTSDIDHSVTHLRAAIQNFDYADAHLMLGYALRNKIADVFTKQPGTNEKDRELISLTDKAIVSFRRAQELNNGFTDQSEEQIRGLTEQRKGFEKRIKSRT